MKIALIEPYPCAPGKEGSALEQCIREQVIASGLHDLGNELLCVKSTRSTEGSQIIAERIPWQFVPIDSGQADCPDNKVECSLLIELVRRFQPDVLLVRGAGTHIEQRLLEASAAPVVTVVSGRYRTSSLSRADLILGEHRRQMMFLRRRVGWRRVKRLQKLPAPWFFPASDTEAGRQYDIVVVSKFEPHKNHAGLDALIQEPIRVALIGDGSLREDFVERWKDAPADVHFLGSQPSQAVADLIRQSRLLVHPSLSEGFPRCVAEAMACGVPCVAVRGVVNEPVKHRRNGLTVPPSAICETVVNLLNDQETLLRYGRSARETAEREFSRAALDDFILGLNRQLHDLLGRKPRRFTARSRVRGRAWNASTAAAGHARRAFRWTRSRLLDKPGQ